MTTIPVLISIRSKAHREDVPDDETMTMLTSGQMELDEEKAVIRYEETLDESLPAQSVEVDVEDDCVTMIRGGAYETQMVFRMGSRYEGQYHTPVGDMELAIYCTHLDYEVDEQGGTVTLSYQLDLNGQFAAVHELELRLLSQGHEDESDD